MTDVGGIGSGGFFYGIDVGGNYEEGLKRFVELLAATKDAVTQHKADFAALSAANAKAKQEVGEVARAQKASAAATEESTKAAKKSKTELSEQDKALKNVNAAIRKKNIAEKEQAIIEQQNITVLKQKARGTTEETEAQRLLNLERSKARIDALKEARAQSEGFETAKARSKRIRDEAEAARTAARAAREKATADKEAARQTAARAKQTDILTEAVNRATKADRKKQVTETLRQFGRDAQGNEVLPLQGPPLPPTSELQGPDPTKAQLIAQAARERLAIERELAALGLDSKGNALLTLQEQIQRRINAIVERRIELEQIKQGLAAQGLDERGLVKLKTEEVIQKRINAILEKRALLEGVRKGLEAQGLDIRGAPVKPALTLEEQAKEAAATKLQRLEKAALQKKIEDANPRYRELQKELGATASIGNRVAFTFRRLFGIFAAFTAVRLFIGQLRQAITNSIAFNAEIEKATLGIASLIQATGVISTPLGKATSATESFTLAQKEARRQVELLRKENLRTAATLPELARAFESSIGPGLLGGLSLDEIRKFSASVAKAASAVGLDQNQLPEEVRSILQGTISKRNTRIATALGITNDDISRAKELGQLFQFLEQKFRAFEQASDEGLKTFSVRLANSKDILNSLLAEGFGGFFQTLSNLLDLINNKLAPAGDKFKINPAAVKAIEQLGSILTLAVEEARRLIENLSAGDAEVVFKNISFLLKGIISLLSIVVEGLLKGISIASVPISLLVNVLEAITNKIGPGTRAILVTLLAWLVAFKSITFLFGTLPLQAAQLLVSLVRSGAVTKLLAIDTAAMSANLGNGAINARGMAVAIGTVAARVAAITALLLLVPALFQEAQNNINKYFDKQEGFQNTQLTFFQTLKVLAFDAFLHLRIWFETLVDAFATGWNVVKVAMLDVSQFIVETLIGSIIEALKLLPGFVPGVKAVIDALTSGIDAVVSKINSERALAQGNIDAGGGFVARREKRIEDATAEENAFTKSMISAEETGVDLVKAIEEMPGIVGTTTKEMDSLVDSAKTLKDELEAAQESFRVTGSTLGTEGAVQQQAKLVADARARLEKEQRGVTAQISVVKADILRVEKDSLEIQTRISKLNKDDLTTFNNVVSSSREILDLQHQLAEAKEKGDVLSVGNITKQLDEAKQRASHVFDGVAIEKQRSIFELAQAFSVNLGQQISSQKSLNEATRVQADLRRRIFETAEAKIAEIGIKEFEEGKNRLREADLQLQAAEKLASVRSSRNAADETVFNAAVEQSRLALELRLLEEKNRKQQDGLRFIAAQFKGTALGIALNAQLNQLLAEGVKLEQAKAAELQGSSNSADLAATLRREAHESTVRALRAELEDSQALLKNENELIAAKRTRGEFDDQLAESFISKRTQELKIKRLTEEFSIAETIKAEEVRSTVDPELRKQGEEELLALRQKNLAVLVGERAALLLLAVDTDNLVRLEKERRAQLDLETQVSRLKFEASRGTDRRAETTAELVGNVALEQQRLSVLTKGTEEYEAQKEALRQASVLLKQFIADQSAPIRSGFMEGIRQFIREAPSQFELSVNVMKEALHGLAEVGAGAITSIFDPRIKDKGAALEQALGELALHVANTIFEGLINQLIAESLGAIFPQLVSSSTGLTVAAGQLTAAGTLWQGVAVQLQAAAASLAAAGGISLAGSFASAGAGALGGTNIFGVPGTLSYGGRVSRHEVVRGFARGGRANDPRDSIPAFLRKDEFVMTPEAVAFWGGHGVFDDLNAMRTPMQLLDIAARDVAGESRARPPSPARSSGLAASGSTAQDRRPIPAYMVPSEEMAEMLIAAGASAFDKFLTSRGYKPANN